MTGELFDTPERIAISFEVAIPPMTQGSKTARIVGRTIRVKGQRAVINPQAVMVEIGNMATKKHANGTQKRKGGELDRYRAKVAARAHKAMAGRRLLVGAVELSAEFVFARPQSHYTSTGKITKSALLRFPPLDVSKLVRAIEDAMSGVVYIDDRQITRYGDISKRYATGAGVGGVRVSITADVREGS